MTINKALPSIRLVPRETDFLDRKVGQRGELYVDVSTFSVRVYDAVNSGGHELAKADLTNISNDAFAAKAEAAGVGSGGAGDGSFSLTVAADDSTIRTIYSGNVVQFTGGSGIATSSTADGEIVIANTQPSFAHIHIDNENMVMADELGSTVQFEAGANMTITANGNTITFASTGSSGGSGASFAAISVPGQGTVTADTAADTLNLSAGLGITITTDLQTNSIAISASAGSGNVSNFTDLGDAVSTSLTVDKFYLPAITRLNVTNSGTTAYRFDQYASAGNNPTIYAITGTTIAFDLSAVPSHPFLLQDATATNYSTGLVHVSTGGVVSTGSNAQGKSSGTLYWKVPDSASGTFRYQCAAHVAMVGSIIVKNFVSV